MASSSGAATIGDGFCEKRRLFENQEGSSFSFEQTGTRRTMKSIPAFLKAVFATKKGLMFGQTNLS